MCPDRRRVVESRCAQLQHALGRRKWSRMHAMARSCAASQRRPARQLNRDATAAPPRLTPAAPRGRSGVIRMSKYPPAVASVACLVLSATLAAAQPRDVVLEEVTLRGAVAAVDHFQRVLTVRAEQGNLVVADIPVAIQGFDQIRVGDVVTMSYTDRATVRAKPAGEPAINRALAGSVTPAPGSPGGLVASQRITTVTITGWDPATRVVTFRGPKGAEVLAPPARRHRGERPVEPAARRARRRGVERGDPAVVPGRRRTGRARRPAASLHHLGAVRRRQPVQRQDDRVGHRADDHRCSRST